MGKVIRYMIADYLGVPGSEGTVTNHLMGLGFSSLDENPSAVVDETAFINDKSASGTITGYKNTFSFETQFISDETAIKHIYDIARNQKTGTDAEADYYRVDVYNSASGTSYPARKFRVSIEVTGITGAGTEIVNVAGNLHQVGNFVEGTFDTATKEFTAAV